MSGEAKQEQKKNAPRFPKLDYRCAGSKCSRLLFRAILMPGTVVDIRCPRCNTMNVVGVALYGTSTMSVAGRAVTITENGVDDE